MKLRNYLLALASTALVACSSTGDDAVTSPDGLPKPDAISRLTDTELFAGILDAKLENNGLQSISEAGSETTTGQARQSILPEAKTANAYFTTRIDGYLNQRKTDGGWINKNDEYFPLSENNGANKVVAQLPENTGTVFTNYPAIPYEKDASKHMESYVFSTDGSATSTILRDVPEWGDVLKAHYPNRPYIALDYDKMPADVNKENIHIIWYVAKLLNYGDKLWHVDGILTDKNDIREVMARDPQAKFWEVDELEPMTFDKYNATLRYDEEVNVDVNQQSHTDWGEVKTTIHLKSAKDVKVSLPIVDPVFAEHPELLKSIAAKDYELPISIENFNDKFFATIKVKVERSLKGVDITVSGLTPVALKAIEEQYADGLTIEIHTFTSATDNAINTIWRQLCNASVTSEAKVSGQITSAYKTAKTDVRIFNEKGEAIYGGINAPDAQ